VDQLGSIRDAVEKRPALAQRCSELTGYAGLQIAFVGEGEAFDRIKAGLTDAVQGGPGETDLVPDRSFRL
jgi:hypothetical protein